MYKFIKLTDDNLDKVSKDMSVAHKAALYNEYELRSRGLDDVYFCPAFDFEHVNTFIVVSKGFIDEQEDCEIVEEL